MTLTELRIEWVKTGAYLTKSFDTFKEEYYNSLVSSWMKKGA